MQSPIWRSVHRYVDDPSSQNMYKPVLKDEQYLHTPFEKSEALIGVAQESWSSVLHL